MTTFRRPSFDELLDHIAAKIILAAAVIDDVIGLLVLAVVSSVAKGAVNYAEPPFAPHSPDDRAWAVHRAKALRAGSSGQRPTPPA